MHTIWAAVLFPGELRQKASKWRMRIFLDVTRSREFRHLASFTRWCSCSTGDVLVWVKPVRTKLPKVFRLPVT